MGFLVLSNHTDRNCSNYDLDVELGDTDNGVDNMDTCNKYYKAYYFYFWGSLCQIDQNQNQIRIRNTLLIPEGKLLSLQVLLTRIEEIRNRRDLTSSAIRRE